MAKAGVAAAVAKAPALGLAAAAASSPGHFAIAIAEVLASKNAATPGSTTVASKAPAVVADLPVLAPPRPDLVAAQSIKPQPIGVADQARPVATAKPPAGQPAPPPDAAPPPTPGGAVTVPVAIIPVATIAATPLSTAPASRIVDAGPGQIRAGKAAMPVTDPALPVTVTDAGFSATVPQALVAAPRSSVADTNAAPDALEAAPTGAVVHLQSTAEPAPAADLVAGSAVPLPDPAAVVAVTTEFAAIGVAPTRPDSVANTRPTAAPTQQIAAGVQALSRTTDGTRQLVMRLDPPDLGRVQIAIVQPKDGPAAVLLTVERPETLLLVLRDQPGLHQALDRAGVAADGRTIEVQLAPMPQAGNGHAGGAAPDLDARHGGRPARHDPVGSFENDPEAPATLQRLDPPPTWSRVGIDITA